MCHKHDKSCLCLTISQHSPVLTVDVIEHRSACLATPESILGLTGDNMVNFHNDGLTIMNLAPIVLWIQVVSDWWPGARKQDQSRVSQPCFPLIRWHRWLLFCNISHMIKCGACDLLSWCCGILWNYVTLTLITFPSSPFLYSVIVLIPFFSSISSKVGGRVTEKNK